MNECLKLGKICMKCGHSTLDRLLFFCHIDLHCQMFFLHFFSHNFFFSKYFPCFQRWPSTKMVYTDFHLFQFKVSKHSKKKLCAQKTKNFNRFFKLKCSVKIRLKLQRTINSVFFFYARQNCDLFFSQILK